MVNKYKNDFPTLELKDAVALWQKGKDVWNDWVEKNPDYNVDFSNYDFLNNRAYFHAFKFPNGVSDFSGAKFSEVDFADTVFNDLVEFKKTEFKGKALFNWAKFNKNADFHGARFFKEANFSAAEFSEQANFKDTNFNGELKFSSKFNDKFITFENAHFKGKADFSRRKFNGNTSFKNATFSNIANFSNIEFSGNAIIYKANFNNNTDFSHALFKKEANFEKVTFEKEALFLDSQFIDKADFKKAKFSGLVNFENASFAKLINFENAKFKESTFFTSLNTPQSLEEFSFKYATFDGPLDISINAMLPCLIDLTHTKTSHHVSLEGVNLASYENWCDPKNWRKDIGKARRLKQLAEENKNHHKARDFYILEIKAKSNDPKLRKFIRFTDFFYEIFSDYGRSIGRPLLSLGILWALHSILYLTFSKPCAYNVFSKTRQFGNSMVYSASQMFGFFPTSRLARSDIHDLLFDTKIENFIFFLTFTQNFFALILLFLLGLGLRHQYRI